MDDALTGRAATGAGDVVTFIADAALYAVEVSRVQEILDLRPVAAPAEPLTVVLRDEGPVAAAADAVAETASPRPKRRRGAESTDALPEAEGGATL